MSCSTVELTLLICSTVGFVLSEVIPFVPGSKAKSILQLLSNILIAAGKAVSPVAVANEVSQSTTSNFELPKTRENHEHPAGPDRPGLPHRVSAGSATRITISQQVDQCQTCGYYHLGPCPEAEA